MFLYKYKGIINYFKGDIVMVKVENKFNVQPNSDIKGIYSKLNTAQKAAIVLFDANRNNKLDSNEAKAFNTAQFSLQSNGDLNIWLNFKNGKKELTTVKKDELGSTTISLTQDRMFVRSERKGNKKSNYYNVKDSFEKTEGIDRYSAGDDYQLSSIDSKTGNRRYESETWVNRDGKIQYMKNYRILDVNGNFVESKDILNEGESQYYAGYEINKNGLIYSYDSDNKFVGLRGRGDNDFHTIIKDSRGNILYSVQKLDSGNTETFMDASGKQLYTVYYNNLDPSRCDVRIYNDDDKEKYIENVFIPSEATSTPLDMYHKLPPRDKIVQDGCLNLR